MYKKNNRFKVGIIVSVTIVISLVLSFFMINKNINLIYILQQTIIKSNSFIGS